VAIAALAPKGVDAFAHFRMLPATVTRLLRRIDRAANVQRCDARTLARAPPGLIEGSIPPRHASGR